MNDVGLGDKGWRCFRMMEVRSIGRVFFAQTQKAESREVQSFGRMIDERVEPLIGFI